MPRSYYNPAHLHLWTDARTRGVGWYRPICSSDPAHARHFSDFAEYPKAGVTRPKQEGKTKCADCAVLETRAKVSK